MNAFSIDIDYIEQHDLHDTNRITELSYRLLHILLSDIIHKRHVDAFLIDIDSIEGHNTGRITASNFLLLH